MALKHVLKLSSINEFLDNDNKIIKKGENALESDHVKRMQFDADLMMIRGEVHASMKDKFYHVEITLNKSGDIISANCACPRGIKCHHIATLALFGHYNISVTDKECTWNVPKSKNAPVKTAEDLYPAKPYSAIKQVISEEQINNLKKKLNDFGNTVGFTWLLQEKDEEFVNCDLPIIEDIVSSNEFTEATNPIVFFKQKCTVDDETIKKIAILTKGQTHSEKWYLIRKFRLTASNFGVVISSCKRNKFPESLFKSLIGAYNLDGIKAIQWGRTHENNGIEYLKTSLNLDIQPTGIWLTKSGLLGASPDGLVGDDSIVEVKCPYSYRNDHLSQALKSNNKYIIYYNTNDEIVVNKNHNYYHQIQGNLHILKRSKCYLCIWTLKEVTAVLIEYDPLWAENLSHISSNLTSYSYMKLYPDNYIKYKVYLMHVINILNKVSHFLPTFTSISIYLINIVTCWNNIRKLYHLQI